MHRHPLLCRIALALLTIVLLGSLSVAAQTVNGSLLVDPNNPAGTDQDGRVLVFAPSPLAPGSSISHFDLRATPDLLMEPQISGSLPFAGVDLTIHQLGDIGWQPGTSQVTIRFEDNSTSGFNDPTLGARRRAAIQFVADQWEQLLGSSVRINIGVSFDALTCANNRGTLAQASANFLFRNFPGAPVAGHWHHGPLAEALSGQNLSLQDTSNANAADVGVTFNSAIDENCLGGSSRYTYDLNGNVPASTISFVNVAMHEIAHGLGFSNFTNVTTGAQFMNTPDIYDRFVFDNQIRKRWSNMSDSERVQSATNDGQVAWVGNRVTANARNLLTSAPTLRINSPASIAGAYVVGTASFGPPLSAVPISGNIALARDNSANPNQACGAVVNPGQVNGRLALIDRGACNFTVKVANAQAAGARGVIIVNNVAGGPPGMSGTDNSIVIPTVSVTMADGALIKAALAGGGGGGGGGSCPVALGSGRFCTDCGPCAAGEGDCDRDSECQAGLVCTNDVGADFGFNPNIDVCTQAGGGGGGGGGGSCPLPAGHGRFCVDCGPCAVGQGDCDNDAQCQPGLVCSDNVGADFGFNPNIDVCTQPGGGGGSCPLPAGNGRFCTECGPCAAGQGDCDNDNECQPGLTCTDNVGADFGFPPAVDVCL